ncbi:Reverse transcriptase domain, partial [Cinara cedri]
IARLRIKVGVTFITLLLILHSYRRAFGQRLILARLDAHLDSTGNRSPNQYGYRQGSSTSDAIERLLNATHYAALDVAQHRDICVAVYIEVKNAFNTAPWKKVDNALRDRNVPSCLVKMIRFYLQDRSILVGETLHQNPSGVQPVEFADNVCVIGIARTGEAAATILNPVLAKVSAWMEQSGLKLAPTKTEAIDTRLSFTKHIQQAARKAADSANAIGRLKPNLGVPSQNKGVFLGTVVNSKMIGEDSVPNSTNVIIVIRYTTEI